MKYNKDVALLAALCLAFVAEDLEINEEKDKEIFDRIKPVVEDVIGILDEKRGQDIIDCVLSAISNIQVYAEEYEALEREVE